MRVVDYNSSGEALAESLHEYGFCVVKNHPIPRINLEEMQTAWLSWFVKGTRYEAYGYDRSTQAGYFAPSDAETAQGATERDRKAYWQIFKHRIHKVPRWFDGVWLDRITLVHWQTMERIADDLLYKIWAATAPDIKANFAEPLSGMAKGSKANMLRVAYYPGAGIDDPNVRIAAHAHTDVNLLTIIPMASAPGLQLQLRADGEAGRKGEWIDVPHDPSYLIINAGDMLAEASRGYYPSVLHRVELSEGDRISMPFFVHARPDAPLSPGRTAGDLLGERLKELGVA